MSGLSAHGPSPTILVTILAGGALAAALALTTNACAAGAAQAPAPLQSDPTSACLGSGGKYLGDMKCQMADGSVAAILFGADAIRARNSAAPVTPRSPHAWALATTAITFEFNGDRHDLLTGVVATPEGQERGKHLLSQWWGVKNRDELLGMLNWLQFEGHRADFDELGRRVDDMNELEFMTTKAAVITDRQELNRLEVVRQNHRPLGQKGILAWDLVRFIALCRWGNLAGYLSDMEAWDHIMPAALRLQLTFSSWQDLQNDFLIGRQFWSVEQTQKNGERFRAIYEYFSADSSSPWNVDPWKMDLGVAKPLPLKAN
jgi:Protein of unknown function (DUF1266)